MSAVAPGVAFVGRGRELDILAEHLGAHQDAADREAAPGGRPAASC